MIVNGFAVFYEAKRDIESTALKWEDECTLIVPRRYAMTGFNMGKTQ